jgi:ABC-2 type transport system permease protein
MKNIILIFKREYGSRVRKKSFLLSTFLTPIGILVFTFVLAFILSNGSEAKKIAIYDPFEFLQLDESNLESNSSISFEKIMDFDKSILSKEIELTEFLKKMDLDGILYIPQNEVQNDSNLLELKSFQSDLFTVEQLGVGAQSNIQSALAERIEALKLEKLGIKQETIEKTKFNSNDIQVQTTILGENKEVSSGKMKIIMASFVGGAMMFLIYFIIVIYGNMVMRSVMEEKVSRIIEVMISSVKPFELMMGKILGVGAVGLTQLGIWLLTIPLINILAGLVLGSRLTKMQSMQNSEMGSTDFDEIQLALSEFFQLNFMELFIFFLLFFLAGYLLYASLFAAIGSAMGEDNGEGQSLTMIVIIPVIIGFYIGIAAIEDPNSNLAFFASLFPLFSPIVMPGRIVFEPPLWQILLSLVLLIGTAVFFTWISARIYRIGILMYGKKVGVKEFFKWIWMKD